MLRHYLKLTSVAYRLGRSKLFFLEQNGNVTRRWAGHSKWQNIRHTKQSNDLAKSRTFDKMGRMIAAAVREGGNSNPEYNSQLQTIIDRARRLNMPNTSINTAIKKATTDKDKEVSLTLVVRGPGRCTFLIDVVTDKPERIKQLISSILKKCASRYDYSALNEFEHKAVLICEANVNDRFCFDKAIDHAILIDAEDVAQIEEKTKLKFLCAPENLLKAKKGLEKLGYNIESASHEYLPRKLIVLQEQDLDICAKLIKRLEEHPEVIRVVDNIS